MLLTRAVAMGLALESKIYRRIWRNRGYGKNNSDMFSTRVV